MPLLLSIAAAIGFSLAAVLTPPPQEPSPREAFTWDGMQKLLTPEVSTPIQSEETSNHTKVTIRASQ
jgi:hypothetical protein